MNQIAEIQEDVSGVLGPHAGKLRATRVHQGPWSSIRVNHGITMSQLEQEGLQDRLSQWVQHFQTNPENLATEVFGIPSTLIRFDYVYTPNVGPRVYEVEERPMGIGMVSLFNGKFKAALNTCVTSWETGLRRPIAICISKDRWGNNDDEVWAERLLHRRTIPVFKGVPNETDIERYAWWVRCSRHEVEYAHLTPHALSTLTQEGDKSYGVGMGLWHPIGNITDLPLESGCALKPRFGSRFEAVQMVRGESDETGFISVGRALKEIKEGLFAYWQPFFRPEGSRQHTWLRDDYRLIRRVYFAHLHKDGALSQKPNFVCVGGCWMATPTHRVHGTSEALNGPIYPHSQDWK